MSNTEGRLKKYTIVMMFLLAWFASSAQPETYHTITGTVLDGETSMPLENASINISNQSLGTITNSDGQFWLEIPRKLKIDSLLVTYLGYGRQGRLIEDVLNTKNLVIRLMPTAVLLGEITVLEEGLNAENIITKAIDRIKDNYPSTPFVLEGFFRDIVKEDDRYVALTEAAISVYDKHFQRRLNHGITEDVRIIETRNSVNYADPLVRKVRKQNVIVDLLDNNSVHYQRGLLNTKFFDYEVDSVIQNENDVIYIISTIPGDHHIFVNEASHAILKTIETYQDDGAKHPEFQLNDSLLVRRMVYFHATSEFQHFNGKMYLKYLNETDAYEILHKSTRKRKLLIETYKEFVVTNIYDSAVMPFGKKEIYNFHEGLDCSDYNAAFWDNFSTIQLSPIKRQVQRDLEIKLPLKDQFRMECQDKH